LSGLCHMGAVLDQDKPMLQAQFLLQSQYNLLHAGSVLGNLFSLSGAEVWGAPGTTLHPRHLSKSKGQ